MLLSSYIITVEVRTFLYLLGFATPRDLGRRLCCSLMTGLLRVASKLGRLFIVGNLSFVVIICYSSSRATVERTEGLWLGVMEPIDCTV